MSTGARAARPAGISPRVWALYRASLVVDLHDDLPSRILDDDYDPGVRHAPGVAPTEGHSDLPRFVEAGVAAVWLAAFVHARHAREPGASFARAVRGLEAIRALAERHPDAVALATRAADVARCRAAGRVALFAGVEGGHAIEGSLERLERLHALGARYLTLVWNNGNDWAGSSLGEDDTSTGGLTPFGREVVRALARLGMLVDLSHASDRTALDVLDTTDDPVLASHSAARALCDHPRNVSDDLARRIAAGGGLIGVNFYARFLDAAWGREVDAGRTPPLVPLARLADHVAHLADVAGAAHVAIGSDFNGIDGLPHDLPDVTALPRLAEELHRRGFTDAELQGVLGGNALRVMERVLDR